MPYLPTPSCISGEVLCSQDVSMYHVLHKGEVHQILPVSVGRWGMVKGPGILGPSEGDVRAERRV